ncbi:DUF3105 domain-containing protein [Nocardioides jejuensis]|uniref:DUF3105 domain-containing protein n=1 Tax=Nocardioides jejuensis TaxID=2502782 RepID=UPI001FB2358B|nr:DUF3105 domain-containing protein [Nocardioides jejuensis]
MASSSSDRRAAVDKIRRDAKRSDQRQGRVILTVAVMIALLIVGGAAFKPVKDWWDLRSLNGVQLADIGAKASVCGPRSFKAAQGDQKHVDPGTFVDYSAEPSPPAFGEHELYPDTIRRKLYTEKDRPRVEMLVHNLEHGYTILWYDDTIAKDGKQMDDLRGIAEKFQGTDDFRLKIKLVPWLKADGKPFPAGQHVAITHWAKKVADEDEKIAKAAKVTAEAGVWEYCSAVSGDALKKFMTAYPYFNSPEPSAA